MRKLIITRGPQGVGKSALRSKLGLDNNSLSSDEIRLLFGAPDLSASGQWGISQERAPLVWSTFDKVAKERMERGETLYLDAMFLEGADIRKYLELAAEHNYKAMLADFSKVPLEVALEQDQAREPLRRVGKAVLEKTAAAFARSGFDHRQHNNFECVEWTQAGGVDDMAARIGAWLKEPKIDLSSYKQVIHIGDLQGCFEVLAGPGAPLENGFDPEVFYVFCGDLVDRGMENGNLVAWFRDNAAGMPNVALVWGNHEDHLWRFANGQEAVSKEFAQRTLPQLLASGVTPADAGRILSTAVDLLAYSFHGSNVVVNHAGLTGLPPRGEGGEPLWHLLSRHQLSKGAGSYSDPVDEVFSRSQSAEPEALRWTQVHGHRNKDSLALQHRYSVNLEDGVEFGGNLRWAVLSKDGWSAHERANKVFASWRQRFVSKLKPGMAGVGVNADHQKENGETKVDEQLDQKDDTGFAFDVKAPIPAWITEQGSAPARLEPGTLAQMRAHEGVMEKSMPDRPHISSLNFTKAVFFDKAWDDVVVKARGLFIDTETGDVASRGYDKFFNIGEREDTELSALSKTLVFPVVGYLKENGYLGNLGYDAKRDELMFASKSTTGSDFAAWFKEIFEASVPEQKREELKRYLRDAEACMAFEVVDPVRDPHMIEYAESKVVLLDVFHRSEDGRKLPYSDMRKAAAAFGLAPKGRMFEFKTMEALTGWITKAYQHLNYRYSGQDIEGVVFEDAAGYQTKCKMPHYGFWKSMRSSKDRVARLKEKIAEIHDLGLSDPKKAALKAQELSNLEASLVNTKKSDSHPMAVAFVEWCHGKQPSELAGKSIIELRSRFDKEVGIDPAWMTVKWDRFDPTEKEGDPAAAKAVEAKKQQEKVSGASASTVEEVQQPEAAEPVLGKPKM